MTSLIDNKALLSEDTICTFLKQIYHRLEESLLYIN